MEYTNWQPLNPNNPTFEHYLQMYGRQTYLPGSWNDSTNSADGGGGVFSYIVEYGAPARVLPTTPVSRPQAALLSTRSSGATGLTLVTHGWRESASTAGSWAQNLAADIGSQTIPAWDVRAYDWGRYSGSLLTGPGYAMRNANYIGTALGSQILSMGYTSVHFVGHSAGSWLIDGAADALAGSGITI